VNAPADGKNVNMLTVCILGRSAIGAANQVDRFSVMLASLRGNE
jgi:hypothetical protein